jgi:hypothetical protein
MKIVDKTLKSVTKMATGIRNHADIKHFEDF